LTLTVCYGLYYVIRKGWFAAFLTFDKNGKIITDRTYMKDMDRSPDPAKAKDPKIKKAMEEMKKAHSRMLADQWRLEHLSRGSLIGRPA
jgi:hypothetical protein